MPSPRQVTDGVPLEVSKPKPHGKRGTSILFDCTVTTAWIPSVHCPFVTIQGLKFLGFNCVDPGIFVGREPLPFHKVLLLASIYPMSQNFLHFPFLVSIHNNRFRVRGYFTGSSMPRLTSSHEMLGGYFHTFWEVVRCTLAFQQLQ